ncbi:MAG: phage holin family protein [Methylobacillus sp.]|jgi:putative membrane protein|nr:phage holin family protein [Methylobacillus sp.]
MRLILLWCCNALALLAVAYLLPGVHVDGFGAALIAALILGLINTLVRPILILLTLPVTVVTLGLFLLVLNGLLFWFAGSVLRGFEVTGFWWAMLGALLYSIISSLLSTLIPGEPPRRPPGDDDGKGVTIDHDTI